MVLLTVKDTKNEFTVYMDCVLQNVSKIALFSVVINLTNSTIPDVVQILCNEIEYTRLYNGARSKLLLLINKREDNQITYESMYVPYCNLANNNISQLTFAIVDGNNNKLTNISSIYLDIEMV